MKKLQLTLLCFISALSFALAQQEKGDKVINANVSFTKQEDQDATTTITGKFGKFFTQNLEVGITPTITLSNGATLIFAGAYGSYNFLTEGSKAVPYIGANLGLVFIGSSQGEDQSGLFYGANAGMRYFFAEKTFFDAGLAYNAFSFSGVSSSSLSLNLGIGVIIGSLK